MKATSIFVSSTTKDLSAHRTAVVETINSVRTFVTTNQDNFGTLPSPPLESCVTLVKQSDIFVGLFAHYRGWEIEADQHRRSITEIEYDTAVDSKIPIFAAVAPNHFLMPANLVGNDAERQRQASFLERVKTRHVVTFEMDDPHKMANVLITSIFNFLLANKLSEMRPAAEHGRDTQSIPDLVDKISHKTLLDYEHLLESQKTKLPGAIEKALLSTMANVPAKEKLELVECLGDLFFFFDHEKSKQYYLQVLRDDDQNPHVLNRIGQLCRREGNNDDALRLYRKALEVPEVDDLTKLRLLLNAGAVLAETENYVEAEMYNHQAISLAEKTNDIRSKAGAYTNLSMAYLKLGETEKSLQYATEAFDLETSCGNVEGASHDINNIASIHLVREDVDQAIRSGLDALNLNRRVGRPDGIGIAHCNLSQAYKRQGDLDSAVGHGREAIRCFMAADHSIRVARAYGELGRIYVELRDFDKGSECFDAASRYYRKIDRVEEAVSAGMISGLARSEAGHVGDAIKVCEAALGFGLRRAKGPTELGESYWGYISVLRRAGRDQAAVRVLRKVGGWLAGHSLQAQARVESAIGLIYMEKGRFEKALRAFRQIEERRAEFEDDNDRGMFLGNFGLCLMKTGSHGEGYDKLKKSIEIFEHLDDARGLANNYTNISWAAAMLGRIEEARKFHNLAVKYERKTGTVGLHEADKHFRDLIVRISTSLESPMSDT